MWVISGMKRSVRKPFAAGFLLVTMAFTLVGCRKSPPPPPPPVPVAPAKTATTEPSPAPTPANEATSPVAVPSTDSAEATQTSKAVAPSPNDPSLISGVETDQDAVAPETPSGTASAEPGLEGKSRDRLVFLLEDGLLLADLDLQIDGKPFSESMVSAVEQALRWCDTDGDGRPTWKEAAASPRFLYGQAGNSPTREPGAAQKMITLYDVNRDGIVNREELPRFLTRNSGKARPFAWSVSNEYHDTNRAQSAVRLWLDSDGDGLLGSAEIEAAPQRLRLRDSDGDDTLLPAEMRDTVMEEPDRLSNRRQTNAPDSVLLVGSQTDWSAVHYGIRERYVGSGELKPGELPFSDDRFAKCDQDGDGVIRAAELSFLENCPADLTLVVRCGRWANTESEPPLEVRVETIDSASFLPKTRFGNRFAMQVSATTLEFFVNDQIAQDDFPGQANMLVARYDADKNGYLEESEFPDEELGMQVPIEAVDEDQNAKVFPDELARYLSQRDAAVRSQIRGRAADHPDALFTALDTDGDGRLKTRELDEVPNRLRQLDADADGQIKTSEIPVSLVVGFVRGNAQQEAALFVAPPPAALKTDQSIPRWFRSMDANDDGEISQLEFPGTTDIFQRLDTNGDRFLTPNEATTEITNSEET